MIIGVKNDVRWPEPVLVWPGGGGGVKMTSLRDQVRGSAGLQRPRHQL